MNRLDEALADILTKAISTVDTAGSFLIEEIPEVLQQLLLWYTTKYAILIVVSSVLLGLVVTLFKHCIKRHSEEAYSDWFLGVGLSGLVGVAAALYLVSRILGLAQILIAPKVWLIEYASHLIK